MLNVYKVMSENISAAIAANGEAVTKQPIIKSMRVVKKETLNLISSWVSRTVDSQIVSFSQGWEVQGISTMQTLHLEPIFYFFSEVKP